MTIYSFKSYATRTRTGERTKLVTVKQGHPLNNDHRAPYSSGATAARALLAHAQRMLSDPARGIEYFNALRNEHDDATVNGRAIDARLQARQQRANSALAASDIELTPDQIELTVRIAQIQAELATKLMVEAQTLGNTPESVIDQVDAITRRALRSATSVRTGEAVDREHTSQVLARSNDLVGRLGRISANGHDDDRATVDALVSAIRDGNADAIEEARRGLVAKLAPEAVAMGRAADENAALGVANGDASGIVRRFTALVESDRAGVDAADQLDPNAWQRSLVERLSRIPDIDHETNAELVNRLATSIYTLENNLPLAVERDEPIYEIDDALDPIAVARARTQLSNSMGPDFDPNNPVLVERLDDQARNAVWATMNEDERILSAHMIALTPAQRIEVGMQVVNSTPSLIRLPEAELGRGRYDVRMATEEEGHVMDSLIRWAGDTRTYPGAEASHEALEGFKELPMQAGELGAQTRGVLVASDAASIEFASGLVAKLTENDPDVRIILMADTDQAADAVIGARNAALVAAGREPSGFAGVEDATRVHGGWTLPGDGDRRVPTTDRGAHILVAGSDGIVAFNGSNSLDTSGYGRAAERITTLTTQQREANKAVQQTIDGVRTNDKQAGSPKLLAQFERVAEEVPFGRNTDKDNAAGLSKTELAAVAAFRLQANALTTVTKNLSKAEKDRTRLERQSTELAYNRATQGERARARVIEAANRQGKLEKVFVPAGEKTRSAFKTSAGSLAEQKPFTAALKAGTLLDGAPYEQKALTEALSTGLGTRKSGRGAVNVTLVAGSNMLSETMGGKGAIDAIMDRVAMLPKNGIIVIDDNPKAKFNKNASAIAQAEKDKKPRPSNVDNEIHMKILATGRDVIHATAWRVLEESNPIIDGRRTKISDRRTEMDYGVVGGARDDNGNTGPGRRRELTLSDLKGAVVVVHGAGQMARETYDAVMTEAARRGEASHSLTPSQAQEIRADLVKGGMKHLPEIELASTQQGDAIAREVMVDISDQAFVATDSGIRTRKGVEDQVISSDFHSATLIRLAAESDKLASVVDRQGKPIEIETAREQSLPFAQTIVDNNLKKINDDMGLSAGSDDGQLILQKMPGVDALSAMRLGKEYETLGDIYRAAEAGEASKALPSSMHFDMARAASWANAVEMADKVIEQVQIARMEPISATSDAYPEALREGNRGAMLFTMGDVDLSASTVGLVTGGTSRPTESDLDAIRNIARDAAEKGWAVSIHLSGEASTEAAKAINGLPEGERPRLLLVGDGHPYAHDSQRVVEAVAETVKSGGGYLTGTAPAPREGQDRSVIESGEAAYVADRRANLELHARQADAMVVVKSSGSDMEMLGLRTAIEGGKPIAALGPSDVREPQVSDMRFRGADYSANRRLLQGGDAVSVMLDNRHLAIVPNFIASMADQVSPRYIPFEGSTAGVQNPVDNNRTVDDQNDRGAIELAERVHARIDWARPAHNIGDGTRTDEFLARVDMDRELPQSERSFPSIAATEKDRNDRSLENDARFLDVASRTSTNREVREVFSEIDEKSADLGQEMQEQMWQRARSGAGR